MGANMSTQTAPSTAHSAFSWSSSSFPHPDFASDLSCSGSQSPHVSHEYCLQCEWAFLILSSSFVISSRCHLFSHFYCHWQTRNTYVLSCHPQSYRKYWSVSHPADHLPAAAEAWVEPPEGAGGLFRAVWCRAPCGETALQAVKNSSIGLHCSLRTSHLLPLAWFW